MSFATQATITLVAVLHVLFLVLEMFIWTKPLGRKVFGLKQEFANRSAALAANQGLYNGFLAAGLIWGLLDKANGFNTLTFFLSCAIIAGIYGALSVNRFIFWVQAFPAIIALSLLFATGAQTPSLDLTITNF
jgi:putative membrane protein